MVQELEVIGYIRVSTEEQARSGLSLESQRHKLQLYCEFKELRLLQVIQDDGYSAKTVDGRPGMSELVELMRTGRVEGVVINKLDRLTRSLGDWSKLIDEFFGERGRVKLFSVGDEINTTTATGRMMLNIIMTLAQWEREIISERTRDNLQDKIRRGERCGKLRYGYDLADDGKTLVEKAAEQEVIRMMRKWAGEGNTLRAIAHTLAELGIETKEGNPIWTPATISRILKRTG